MKKILQIIQRILKGERFSKKIEKTYQCPVCDYFTLSRRMDDEICRICFWHDDGQDFDEMDIVRGGPNGNLSIRQARENFKLYGAIEERFVHNVVKVKERKAYKYKRRYEDDKIDLFSFVTIFDDIKKLENAIVEHSNNGFTILDLDCHAWSSYYDMIVSLRIKGVYPKHYGDSLDSLDDWISGDLDNKVCFVFRNASNFFLVNDLEHDSMLQMFHESLNKDGDKDIQICIYY